MCSEGYINKDDLGRKPAPFEDSRPWLIKNEKGEVLEPGTQEYWDEMYIQYGLTPLQKDMHNAYFENAGMSMYPNNEAIPRYMPIHIPNTPLEETMLSQPYRQSEHVGFKKSIMRSLLNYLKKLF